MHKSLIIFDWDDTLFPTSWYSGIKEGRINSPKMIKKNKMLFNELDYLIYNVLTNYMQHGKVVIVTNAADRWVKMVLDVLPQTAKLLYKKVEVISARDIYADKFEDVYKWKQMIFQNLFHGYFNNKNQNIHNIISVGDAEYEFESLKRLHKLPTFGDNLRFLKNIKFRSRPSQKEVKDQLKILNKSADRIINMKKHMDLHMFAIK